MSFASVNITDCGQNIGKVFFRAWGRIYNNPYLTVTYRINKCATKIINSTCGVSNFDKSDRQKMTAEQQSTISQTDVVIVGAGPAGQMAAACLARMGVNVRIFDKKMDNRYIGQADGLQSRTLEVFQSMGFGDRAMKESNHMIELCFWDPKGNEVTEGITRTKRIADSIPGVSRFQQTVLHQGRVESWFQDSMRKWSKGTVKVERPAQVTSIEVDTSIAPSDVTSHPVTVIVDHLSAEKGAVEQYGSKIASGLYRQFEGDGNVLNVGLKETIKAKYVIGCDGAHSWVRKQMDNNVVMEGEQTDYIWGVLDGVPVTDFPDIRCRCAIHSHKGSIMIIPREHGLVRLYIQLEDIQRIEGGRIDRSKITPELILKSANNVFAPYKIDMDSIKWFTAYQIGQRVATAFEDSARRIFIAGDACHTHSPKAGQGMNVSMMDTFNLSWKLAHVVKGLADPVKLLPTYEGERRPVAQSLINLDYRLSRLFSAKPGESDPEEFAAVFEKSHLFTSGCTVDYMGSAIVEKDNSTHPVNVDPLYGIDKPLLNPLASRTPIGQRFLSTQVVMQSDAEAVHFGDLFVADGRWRVVFMSGDIAQNKIKMDQLHEIGGYLDSKDSFISVYTPQGAAKDSVIETKLLHSSPRTSVEWEQFPEAFKCRDERGRMDYWSIFADDMSYHHGHGKAYNTYGVDPKVGAIIIVRPDTYVAGIHSFSIEGVKEVEQFFSRFMTKLPKMPSIKRKEEQEFYGEADVGEPVLAL